MALHCSECGFVNPEGANYCQKCGALLELDAQRRARRRPPTGSARPATSSPVDIAEVTAHAAALVIRAGGGRAGESFAVDGRAHDDRTPPRLGGLPRRHHRLARPRAARAPRQRLVSRRLRLAQRHLRQPRADRLAAARRRRRAAGRQVQARPSARDEHRRPRSRAPEPRAPAPKASTIGAVCKALLAEFPDISISKIRYLEDQRLLTPRRTPGGYRLYSPTDVARLRTILRLQRDEFLPLRVIRQELVAGSPETAEAQRRLGGGAPALASQRQRHRGELVLHARGRARGDARRRRSWSPSSRSTA